MSYLVLARKWRPTRFEDVIGQSHITKTLQNAIVQNRIPHALLFVGSRGVGKTTCARILAKAMNCTSQNHPVADPCDQCESCLSITKGNQVDVIEIDGASNNGVEQIREIKESAKFAPSQSRNKIYIIDEVHMLSTNAFNALLKILEEPPAHVIFIFATTDPHKILETIISRCQRFDFKRISEDDIVQALKKICLAEHIDAQEGALRHIAREAQGGMRDSLSLLDKLIAFCGTEISELEARKLLGLTPRQTLKGIVEGFFHQNPAQVLQLVNEQIDAGIDIQHLLMELLKFLRDLMIIKISNEPQKILTLPPSEIDEMREGTEKFDPNQIHRFFNILSKQTDEILKSPYPRLVFEMACLQLCHQGSTSSISDVLSGILKLEQTIQKSAGNQGPTGGSSPSGFKLAQAYQQVFKRADKSVPKNPSQSNANDQEITAQSVGQQLDQLFKKKYPTMDLPKAVEPILYEKLKKVYILLSQEDRFFSATMKNSLKLLEYHDQILQIAYHSKYHQDFKEKKDLLEKHLKDIFECKSIVYQVVGDNDPALGYQSLDDDLHQKDRLKMGQTLQNDFFQKFITAFNPKLLDATYSSEKG